MYFSVKLHFCIYNRSCIVKFHIHISTEKTPLDLSLTWRGGCLKTITYMKFKTAINIWNTVSSFQRRARFRCLYWDKNVAMTKANNTHAHVKYTLYDWLVAQEWIMIMPAVINTVHNNRDDRVTCNATIQWLWASFVTAINNGSCKGCPQPLNDGTTCSSIVSVIAVIPNDNISM